MTDEPVYFGNVLSAFENGAQMDIRLKLAVDFLKAPGFLTISDAAPSGAPFVARFALDLAESLIAQATSRGWLKPLDDNDDLTSATRREIRRQARAQVYAQIQGQRIAQEENPVMPPRGHRLG